MIRTYKIRLYPTRPQQIRLDSNLTLCRELYNAALQERIESYKVSVRDGLSKKGVGRFDQQRQIKEIRSIRPEFQEMYFSLPVQVLIRLDKAFKAFFRRCKRGETPGFPRFKGRNSFNSLTFDKGTYRMEGNRLILGKVGGVKMKPHRPTPADRKTCVVKKICGAWYAFIACDVAIQPLPDSNATVGIDVGLESFATLSDGSIIENPRWYKRAQAYLRRCQRRVSRRKKGSNRRRKAVLLLGKACEHIKAQRQDFQHKLSHELVRNFGFIAVEDLNIKGLAGGMLAKSVHDVGWSNFLKMLAYKAESAGRQFVVVNPSRTSQTCICGASVPKRLSDREHRCTCGASTSRDHMSAQVILQRALSALSGVNVEVGSCVA